METLRVFVAIKPSGELTSALVRYQTMLNYLPLRWIKEDDMHITLIPPWNEENIDSAVAILDDVASSLRPITLRFKNIVIRSIP